MAVPYNALVIAADVDREKRNAIPGFDITDSDTLLVVENLIQEVTGIIEGVGLNRNLIVRKYEHYFQYGDWEWDEARDKYLVRARQWPVVEIDTTGFTIGRSNDSTDDNLILYGSRYSGLVTYYAGYKRSEQVLGDLTSESSLSDLGTAPGDLPYSIRNVAIDGVLHGLAERSHGPGQRARTINPAVQSTTLTEPMLDYLTRIIRQRIGHHRYLA